MTAYWCELAWMGGPSAEPGVLVEVEDGRITGVTSGIPAPLSGAWRTSLDRTAEAQWTSHDTSVATVAPGGLVTAVGFGATHIDAVFEALTAPRPHRPAVPLRPRRRGGRWAARRRPAGPGP